MRMNRLLMSLVLGWLLSNQLVNATEVDLKRDGASGFPQAQAQVLCDSDDLRVSVWTNSEYLFVQAIVWNDSSSETGKSKDGREIGDSSNLELDVDGDQLRTPRIDRTYTLDPWPTMAGLHYQICVSERGWTGLQRDSEGRGAIQYIEIGEGKTHRVDSFLIPLSEFGMKSGESIRLAYYADSTQPELKLNSVGFESDKPYYSHSLPLNKFHDVKLVDGATLDANLVPEVRSKSPLPAPARVVPTPTLTIGSRAPALDIEHWVRNGKGKFEPVKEFTKDKVYIVEFWATWCGPCIAAMPHIAEIQNKYADQGLQVVSISDEQLDVVTKFLERKAPAEKDKEPITYGELTSQYCLTTDPDRSNHDNYMRAAGQNGIPCAFVVGKDGFVEWIGHPMSIDKALAAVLEGNWDRAAYLAEFKQSEELRRRTSEILNLAQKGKFEQALAIAHELGAAASSESNKRRAESLELAVRGMQVELLILKNSEDAPEQLTALLTGQSAQMVNSFVWNKIVLPKEKGRKISEEVLAAAASVSEKALAATPDYSYLLDTYAHLLHVQGQLEKAIEVQEQAVKHVDDKSRESVEKYLKTLRDLKDSPASEKPSPETDKKSS